MKFYSKTLVLAVLTVPFIGASLPEQPQEEQPIVVPTIDDGRVHAFKETLRAQESRRIALKVLTIATVTGAGLYGIHKYNYPSKVELTKEKELAYLKKLAERIDALEQKKNEQDAAAVAELGWYEWFNSKAGGVKDWVVGAAPDLAKIFVRNNIYSGASNMLFAMVPVSAYAVGSYLFQARTMNWCMVIRTNFYRSVSTLLNWNRQLEIDVQRAGAAHQVPPVLPHYVPDLTLSMQGFVGEMEKILGYMLFIKERLKPEHDLERKRADISMDLIKKAIDGLVRKANDLIGSADIDQLAQMNFDIRMALFQIICQMENFEIVHVAAGYKGVGEHDSFNTWKSYVFPQGAVESPIEAEQAINQDAAQMRELFTGIMRNL